MRQIRRHISANGIDGVAGVAAQVYEELLAQPPNIAELRLCRGGLHPLNAEDGDDGECQHQQPHGQRPTPGQAVRVPVNIGKQQQPKEPKGRDHDGPDELAILARQVLQHFVNGEKVPLGPGQVGGVGRVRHRLQRRAVAEGEIEQHQKQSQRHHAVLEDLVGKEPLRLRHVLGLADRPGRCQPVVADLVDVEDNQQLQEHRQRKHVDGEEARQCRGADRLTASKRRPQEVPDIGNAPGDVRADHRRPIRLLVPGQQVARERKRKRQPEQRQADHPDHLPRPFVGAPDEHLQQVQPDQHHHRRSAEVVQTADQASEGQLLDVLDRLVGVVGGRHVVHHHERAGDQLDEECHRHRTAEDVGPTNLCGQRLIHELMDGRNHARLLFDPVPDHADQSHHQAPSSSSTRRDPPSTL